MNCSPEVALWCLHSVRGVDDVPTSPRVLSVPDEARVDHERHRNLARATMIFLSTSRVVAELRDSSSLTSSYLEEPTSPGLARSLHFKTDLTEQKFLRFNFC